MPHSLRTAADNRFGPLNNETKQPAIKEEINTNVWRFLVISEPSICKVIGSTSKSSSFARLDGEEEWLRGVVGSDFLEQPCGVLTSSALKVSEPLRLIDWTSLSSETVPFFLIFFGLEERDIVGREKPTWINKQSKTPIKEANQEHTSPIG
jgi:hypothetical protein